MAENEIILGYDVGGTKLGIGLASSDGKILGKDRIENKDTYPEDILPQMAEKGRRLVADAGLKMSDVKGFGISAPGPADIANGVLTARPTMCTGAMCRFNPILKMSFRSKGVSRMMRIAPHLPNGFSARAGDAMILSI